MNDKNSTRILILSDSRFRDSFGSALLKHKFDNEGYSSLVVSFDLCYEAVKLYKPHVLILNHVGGKRNRDLASIVKASGGLVAVAFTEGRVNTYEQEKWFVNQANPRYCDMFFCWSEQTAKAISNKGGKAYVTGSPRFDIYRPPYNSIITRKGLFTEQYNLDKTKRTIGITSSFPQSKFALMNSKFNKQDWKDLKVTDIISRSDPDKFAKQELENLKEFQLWIEVVHNQFKSDYNVIVKPHPMESHILWEQFSDRTGIPLAEAEYAYNFCNGIDLLLARGDCVTHQDAWMVKTPSVHCIIGDVSQSGAGKESLEYGNFVAKNLMSLISYIKKNKFEQVDNTPYLDKYGFNYENSAETIMREIMGMLVLNNPRVPDIDGNELAQLQKVISNQNDYFLKRDYNGHYGKSVTEQSIREHLENIRNAEITSTL